MEGGCIGSQSELGNVRDFGFVECTYTRETLSITRCISKWFQCVYCTRCTEAGRSMAEDKKISKKGLNEMESGPIRLGSDIPLSSHSRTNMI